MSTKRPAKKKPPAKKAGAASHAIKSLSDREKDSRRHTSGWVDETIPEAAAKYLQGRSEDLRNAVAMALGVWRFNSNYLDHRLTNTEQRSQAIQTADAIEVLVDRIRNVDPHLRARVETAWMRANDSNPELHYSPWNEQVIDHLSSLTWAFREAAGGTPATKRGAKPKAVRATFLRTIAAALRNESQEMTDAAAMQEAAEIAVLCKIPVPEDRSSIRRAMRGQKIGAEA